MNQQVKVVAYAARTGRSKTGNPYVSQIIEIQQSPVRPNASFMRFCKTEADALKPGTYTASFSFYEKDGALTASFFDFKSL